MSWQHISTLCPKGYSNQHGHAVSLRVTAPRQQHDKAASRADVGRERPVCSLAKSGPLSRNQCQRAVFFSRHKLIVCLHSCLSGARVESGIVGFVMWPPRHNSAFSGPKHSQANQMSIIKWFSGEVYTYYRKKTTTISCLHGTLG